ncbi:MAG: Holliday junction branch migration protein RuvA [Bacillota bacterium]|nr:Holliday junction branch migration protein RuvA [Bacillota bacterium]REJ37234.1 MAG: Holliday junction branch migration protein RuvA [Bacillota bacterium]
MIGMLRGRVWQRGADWVIIDVGGVGYRVFVPTGVLSRLPGIGGDVELHVHTHVREDSLALFGFLAEEELRLFEELIAVSGVGPRLALTALSSLSPEQLRRAVLDEDVATLMRIPGIGRKTAQRMILELKGRLSRTGLPGGVPVTGETTVADALAALVSLGYTQGEAAQALAAAQRELNGQRADTAQLVRMALRHLAG